MSNIRQAKGQVVTRAPLMPATRQAWSQAAKRTPWRGVLPYVVTTAVALALLAVIGFVLANVMGNPPAPTPTLLSSVLTVAATSPAVTHVTSPTIEPTVFLVPSTATTSMLVGIASPVVPPTATPTLPTVTLPFTATVGPTAVIASPAPVMIVTPSRSTLRLEYHDNWVSFTNVSEAPLALNDFRLEGKEGRVLKTDSWGVPILQPGECLRIYKQEEPASLPQGCQKAFDFGRNFDERKHWFDGRITVVINPTTQTLYPAQ